MDRLISLFVPMWRFGCPAPNCGWEGLVRRGGPGAADLVRSKRYTGQRLLAPSRRACRAADESTESTR